MAVSDPIYLEFRQDADELLSEFGTDFKVKSQGSFDPETLMGDDSDTVTTVKGVVVDSLEQLKTYTNDMQGTWTATKTLVLSASHDYDGTDTIEVEGVWFSLDQLEEIKPADIPVLYLLDIS